jgi:hypothetical protein
MFLTTRVMLSLKAHGPAALALMDHCSAHHPRLYAELLSACRVDDEVLGPEKLAIAISNHGRLHRGEPGWEWYDAWCRRHDEPAFVDAVVSYVANMLQVPSGIERRRRFG